MTGVYKKQGHGGHWNTSVLIILHFIFIFFGFHDKTFSGGALLLAGLLWTVCSINITNDPMN